MFTKQIIKPFHVVIGAGLLGAVLAAAPAQAADPIDGHAFVRATILNAWTPTAVASATAEKVDAHERARRMIAGAPASAFVGTAAVSVEPALDGHEQARRLLLG